MPDQRTRPSQTGSYVYWAVALGTLAVFGADLVTALGVAVWVFYVAPVVLTILGMDPRLPIGIAAVESALIVVGFYASPPGEVTPAIVALNRTFGVITVWTVAGLARYLIAARVTAAREVWLRRIRAAIVQ